MRQHPWGPGRAVQPGASLQEAIDRLEAGGVLSLAPGAWRENILIEKPLTLRGSGKGRSSVSGREKGYPAIWIAGPPGGEEMVVRLEGLEIGGARGDCAEWHQGSVRTGC
ncbi:MAG: hypothetical protein NUW06_00970 [Candidatus Acetothermia bacterium]|nr:hypothetical protein [Candidatus Acetothermia bacterium]MDH7505668.1 hypothetical protein [Candidatus Acetothermia bacterium]